ncbi:unnamed protein product [Symbiodinium sp. CCMP2592]|nr:unnamed protein product [Symbiodinium sp. CCMP2592]
MRLKGSEDRPLRPVAPAWQSSVPVLVADWCLGAACVGPDGRCCIAAAEWRPGNGGRVDSQCHYVVAGSFPGFFRHLGQPNVALEGAAHLPLRGRALV